MFQKWLLCGKTNQENNFKAKDNNTDYGGNRTGSKAVFGGRIIRTFDKTDVEGD